MKNRLSRKFRNLHFLSSADATFTPYFTLAIIYRLTQHFIKTSALICYPGKWNKIENRTYGPQSKLEISTAGAQICCKPPGWRFARTPYYSSSRGLAILLYESLLINMYLKRIVFSSKLIKFWRKKQKFEIFHFFIFFQNFDQSFFGFSTSK